jgi:FKBP-type peptidyl-prolyl cis-trans isomerase
MTTAATVAVTRALETPRAEAYGLGKPPPTSTARSRETYDARVAAMRRAEAMRDEKDAELADDAPTTTLRSGLRYREYAAGEEGEEAVAGSRVDFAFKVYRLSSGAYFKFSSGGTPILLYGRGYGYEGRDDVGDFETATLGATKLPRAVTPCVVGMRKGGIRRILVPPNLGWVDDDVFPQPDTFAAKRRMENYRDGPLLFEIEVVRVRNGGEGGRDLDLEGDYSYRLPAPPTLVAR